MSAFLKGFAASTFALTYYFYLIIIHEQVKRAYRSAFKAKIVCYSMLRGIFWMPPCSSQRNVEGHHDGEASSEKDSADIRVLAAAHLGDELLHNNVDHGAGGKSQQIGKRRNNDT